MFEMINKQDYEDKFLRKLYLRKVIIKIKKLYKNTFYINN